MTGRISEDVDIGTPGGTELVPVVISGTNKRSTLNAIKSWIVGSLTKSSVGLSSVDNTSDAGKPISTATATALALKEALANKNAVNGYAGLDGSGLLLASVLPAMAISSINVVASQAAMLALTAEQGDVAIRSDLNKTFALSTNSSSTLPDWKELLTPTDVVQSVAGLTGAISASALKAALTLVKSDVGLGSVPNTDATNMSNAAAGVLVAARGGTGTSNGVRQTIGGTSGAATVGAGQTRYVGTALIDAAAASVYVPVSMAGVFKNLNVVSAGSPGVGETYTATFQKTLTSTALTCQIPSGFNAAADTTNSVSFAAGDRFSLKIVLSSGAAATNILWSVEFVPS